MALSGGPHYQFTPAISFVVNCEGQAEVDPYWENLTSGGKEVQCGWLVDKYGVSWQIAPTLVEMLRDKDSARSQQEMKAMFQMKKIDIAGLQAA